MSEPALKTEAKTIARRKADDVVVLEPSETVLSMIERAARDPKVDGPKMVQLLEMHQRMEAQANERRFNDAMASAQADMKPVATDTENKQTKSRYASYPALDRVLRPIYTKHGFALSFNTLPDAPESHVRVVCDATNCGHTRRYQIDMPADGKGAKGGDVMTKTHAAGSAVSYGMRYLLKMIFNVAVGEEDDDGNKAGAAPKETITEAQATALAALMKKAEVDDQIIFEHFKVSSLTELTPAQHATAVNKLNKKLSNA